MHYNKLLLTLFFLSFSYSLVMADSNKNRVIVPIINYLLSSSTEQEATPFVGGSKFPTPEHKKIIFTPDSVTEAGYIYYVASTGDSKLSWELKDEESGYIQVYMPPGITKLHMGVNSESLAASQSIYFKDMGEFACSADIVDAPDYAKDSSGFRVFTGSSNYTHIRKSQNINEESCVLYAFYNHENLNDRVFLQHVSFTYEVGERNLYDTWLQGETPLSDIQASIEASSFSGVAPFSIELNASASGGDGQYTYFWTSGDGVVNYETSEASISYVYQNAGTYPLTLEITDNSGNSKIINHTVIVEQEDTSTGTPLASFSEVKDIFALNENVFTEIANNNETLISYEKPSQIIYQGNSVLLKVLLPKGTTLSALQGQGRTPFFYGSLVGVFSQDPGNYCGENSVCSLEKLSRVGDGFNPTLYQGEALQNEEYRYIVFYNQSGSNDNFTSITTQTVIGNASIYNAWRSEKGFESSSSKILYFKAYSGKNYPENDPLDASAGSAFDTAKLLYSDYLKSYYIPYDIGGIRDWNLVIGESSYVKFFIPPGVSSVGLSFNDASLASQSIELADFGEFDKDYTVENSFDYNAHTWLYKGAQSRTYIHTRDMQNLHQESSLVLAFHDEDNLYANVNLGQFTMSYYIKPEDLDIFNAWVSTKEEQNVDAQYPIDGSSKLFVGGSSFPTQAHKELIFTNRDTDGAVISYVASSAPAQLPWQLSHSQSGYIKVFVPAGISKFNTSINSQSLAASQSLYFKDMGEASCDADLPNAPSYELDSSDWLIFTGARSYSHNMEEKGINTSKCVLYAYYNKDNLNNTAFLQDVSFYYTVGDKNSYNAWVNAN